MELKRAQGSYKEIFASICKDKNPWAMNVYSAKNSHEYWELVDVKFKEQTTLLDKAVLSSKESKWKIAQIMYDILKTGSFSSFYKEYFELSRAWTKANPKKIIQENPYFPMGGLATAHNPSILVAFAKEKYGICKTDLYNMFAVVEEFGQQDGSIKGEVQDFSFYQLVEMLPLSYSDRLKIRPNWTIKEIREYKKSLNSVQTSGQANDEDEDEEVQTSEQPPENEKYKRFEKFTKTDLCDRIIELEEEIKTLKQKIRD